MLLLGGVGETGLEPATPGPPDQYSSRDRGLTERYDADIAPLSLACQPPSESDSGPANGPSSIAAMRSLSRSSSTCPAWPYNSVVVCVLA